MTVQFEIIHPDQHPARNETDWYMWEFLRRNSQYHADFRRFIETYGGWFKKKGYWFDYRRRIANWSNSDEDYFYDKIAQVILRLCRKWHIGNLLPPDWNFDKKTGIHKLAGHEIGLPTGIAPEMNWDLRFLGTLMDMGFTSNVTSATRHANIVRAEFDLNWPMKDLVRHAKRTLAYAQENYFNELTKRGVRLPQGRRRVQDYETHLRVWDLRQAGKRPAEIARVVFPSDSPAYALRKVRDHLKAANKLIQGHYKEIR